MKSLGRQVQVQYATDGSPLDRQAMEWRLPPMRSPAKGRSCACRDRPPAPHPPPPAAAPASPPRAYDPELQANSSGRGCHAPCARARRARLSCCCCDPRPRDRQRAARWAPILHGTCRRRLRAGRVHDRVWARRARKTARPARRASARRRSEPLVVPLHTAAQPGRGRLENDAWEYEDSWEKPSADAADLRQRPAPRRCRVASTVRIRASGRARRWSRRPGRCAAARSAPLADPADIDHGAMTAEIPVVADDYAERRAVNE